MTMTNIENAKQNTPVAKKERYLNYRDIILLENGMTVATDVPAFFLSRYYIFEPKVIRNYPITIGEVYKKFRPESIDEIAAQLLKKIQPILPVTKEQVLEFINSLDFESKQETFDTSIYAGVYKVDSSRMERGQFDLGDGWHVFCSKTDNPSIKVDFYQSGGVITQIDNIQPIGHYNI